jgi:hypothetical protein
MKHVYLFDIFSRKPKLKIDGNVRLSSKYVSLFGIGALLAYIAIAIYLSIQILQKSSMFMLENTISRTSFQNFTFDTDIQFKSVLTDALGAPIPDQDRVFDLRLDNFHFIPSNTSSNLKITRINYANCDQNILPGDDEKLKLNYELYNKFMKCFDLKPFNISIFGDNDPTSPQGSLVFNVNQCVNTTKNNNTCLPQNEIDKRLREVKLSLFYPNIDIDNNLVNPFIKYTNGKVYRLTNTLKTKYFLELDNIEFLSDEGLVFDDILKFNAYQIGEPTIMQNLKLGSSLYPGSFGSVGFYGSGRKKIYRRSYLKFHSIFPYLIGIYQISVLLFKIFASYFGGGRMDEFIFSKIIEKEEFDKFKNANRLILYDDLFKKIPNEKSNSENIDSNLQEENLIESEVPNSYSSKSKEISKSNPNSCSPSFNFNRRGEMNENKDENRNKKSKLKVNNFLQNQENNGQKKEKEQEKEKELENHFQRIASNLNSKKIFTEKENELERQNNSQGFIINKKNVDSFGIKREIKKNKK